MQTSKTLEVVITSFCETCPVIKFSVQLLYSHFVNNLHVQNGTLKRVSLCPINHLLLPYVFPEPVLVNTRKAKMAPKIVHLIKYLFAHYIFVQPKHSNSNGNFLYAFSLMSIGVNLVVKGLRHVQRCIFSSAFFWLEASKIETYLPHTSPRICSTILMTYVTESSRGDSRHLICGISSSNEIKLPQQER